MRRNFDFLFNTKETSEIFLWKDVTLGINRTPFPTF